MAAKTCKPAQSGSPERRDAMTVNESEEIVQPAGSRVGAVCPQCRRPFVPRRTGGRPQRFCGLVCRRSHDAAVRYAGQVAVQTNLLRENSCSSTRAFVQRGQDGGDSPVGARADAEPLVRFLVELQASTLDLLIAGRWLKGNTVYCGELSCSARRELGSGQATAGSRVCFLVGDAKWSCVVRSRRQHPVNRCNRLRQNPDALA